jgi:hypothetical protein
MIESLTFILLNSACLLLAHGTARLFLPRAGFDLLLISTLTLHLFLSTTAILLLGVVGALAPHYAVALVVAPLLWLATKRRAQPMAAATPAAKQATPPHRSLSLQIAILIFSALLSIYVFRGMLDGTRLGWDDLSYHATTPAHWLQAGRIELAPYNYHAYFPFGAELLAAWFMLPFGTDTFASLAGLHWILLATASIASIIYRISGHLPSALLGSAIFLSSTVVHGEALSVISSADLAGTAYMLSAIYLFVMLRAQDGREAGFLLTLIAICAGLATGTKVTYAACAIALGLMVAVHVVRHCPNPIRKILAMALLAIAIGSFWYARNFITTGNPLFPADIGPFKGMFMADEMARTKLTYWLARLPLAETMEKIALPHLRFGGFFLGLTLAIGFLWACLNLVRALPKPANGATAAAIAPSCLLLGLLLVMYPTLPFSGGVNSPDADLQPPLRFLVLALALGAILFGCMAGTSKRYRIAWQALAISLIAASWGERLLIDNLVAIAGSVTVLALVRYGGAAWRIVRNAKFSAPLVFIAIFAALSIWQPVKARRTAEYLEKSWGGHSAYIDKLPAESHLTWFGSIKYYQLFGRSLQHTPIGVQPDGLPYRNLHDLWAEEKQAWWGPTPALTEAQQRALVANIAKQGIEFIVMEKDQASGTWPQQYEAIDRDPAVEKVFVDKYHAIFKIKANP